MSKDFANVHQLGVRHCVVSCNFVIMLCVHSYSVTVTARNWLSTKTSDPVIIQIVQELASVEIWLNGQQGTGNKWAVVDAANVFHAYHYSGSNVTYRWDFGDGSEEVVVVADDVRHNFTL